MPIGCILPVSGVMLSVPCDDRALGAKHSSRVLFLLLFLGDVVRVDPIGLIRENGAQDLLAAFFFAERCWAKVSWPDIH